MREKIYYITGMHCASCELLIERRILKEKGVKAVDASLGSGTLRIESDGQIPHVEDLNNCFKSDGYTFSEQKHKDTRNPLFYFEEGKGIKVDKELLKKKSIMLYKIIAVFFVLYLIERTGIAQYITVNDSSSLGLFFMFGIVAGLSSCAALVGGTLLSLSKQWNDRYGYDASIKTKMTPHFYFHGGRLFAYGLFGGVLGALGKAVTFENITIYSVITIGVSLIMLVIGLQMVGVRWAERMQIRLPKFVTRNVAIAESKKGNRLPFAIGAGTILIPCGFTLIAQGIALTSGSALAGALILIMFAIGTMIPLLFIGFASVKGTQNPTRGRAFSFYAGVVLIIFAFYNINGQMNVLGITTVSDLFAKQDTSDPIVKKSSTTSKERQEILLVVKGLDYMLLSPSIISADIPSILTIDNQGVRGCARYLSARGLMNGFLELQPGKNTVDIGKPQKGTYKITCSMGMVSPIIIKVQ